MTYRGRELNISADIFKKYLVFCHAPIEKYFIDSAIHRKFNVDVTCDSDISDFSCYEIEEAINACANEDILAMQLKRA